MALGLSMVMVNEETDIDAAKLVEAISELAPNLSTVENVDDNEETISLDFGKFQVILGFMPAPIPWSDLEGPCETSILWKEAAAEVSQHQFHWIVTVMAEEEPLELSRLLTIVTAAVMMASASSIGVYWGNSTMVIPKELFVEFTQRLLPLGPPVTIWVDFRVGRDAERGSSGFTTGMTALGHKEFETWGAPEPPRELYQRLMSLVEYVLEKGPVIRNGDTIGEDENEKIRIVFSDSSFGHEGQVMRLVYETPSTKKPWWKLW